MAFRTKGKFEMSYSDRLAEIFVRQRTFMDALREHDKFPEFPVDMTTKQGQRLVGECSWNLIKELAEANVTLKNKMHRLTEASDFDREHYVEELVDTLSFFIELCIMSDIGADELHSGYVKKNAEVHRRLEEGY